MKENQLDRMENMLSLLISKVENSSGNQSKMKEKLNTMESRLDKIDGRLDKMESRQVNMENRLDKLEQGQTSMRNEIMAKLTDMQADQDHIWEKVARNERELAKLKFHL